MEKMNIKFDISDLDVYPSPDWGNNKKYNIKVHLDGVVVRGKNFRTIIQERTNDKGVTGYLQTSYQIINRDIPEINHPMVLLEKVRKNLYMMQRFLRKDSYEMVNYGLHVFFEKTKGFDAITGTWTHSGEEE